MQVILWYGKAFLVMAVMAVPAVALSGCQTVEGLGRDVQAAGGGVEEAAENVRPYEAPRR